MGLPAVLTLDSPADTLRIRIGTPEDMHDCMALALTACEENGFLNPAPDKLAQEMWSALSLDNGIVGLIGQPDGKPEGITLLRIGSMWYSRSVVVEEKAIFIHKDFRSAKGGRGRKLCEFGKSVADALQIPLIIGVLSNTRTEAKTRMYRRILGEPAGAFWLYGVRTGEYVRSE